VHAARASGRSFGKQCSLEQPDGTQWFEISVARKPTEPGQEERFIAIARDITERKRAEDAIEHLAFHDSLTGLANRRLLQDRLKSAAASSQRAQKHAALLFLDLDKFKELNDTFGHDAGDLLLQEVARRLQLCSRSVDTLARIGGDEFVLLVQDLSNDVLEARRHASTVGHKVITSLNEPYILNGNRHVITPSVGVTLFQGGNEAPEVILKRADTAMYQAKANGRNTLCFFGET
jgi:diguanylate cyclase (GGDEF)-like protein